MKTIAVDLVTPERKVYEGQAKMVVAKGVEGEIGIQPGHIPLVTPLNIGVLRVIQDGREQLIAVSGGFLEVRPDKVTILAETAELPEEIDVNRAERAKERAERALGDLNEKDTEYRINESALQRAVNRINIANKK